MVLFAFHVNRGLFFSEVGNHALQEYPSLDYDITVSILYAFQRVHEDVLRFETFRGVIE